MENKHIIKTLIDLGLDKKQAEIYLAALMIGRGTITELSKTGNLERTGIYYHLDRLINMGLIEKTKRGKRIYYLPIDPQKLQNILKSKKKNLDRSLPVLEKLFRQKISKSTSSYFQGEKELINLYNHLSAIASRLIKTNPNEKYYIFGHSFEAYEALPKFFPKYFAERVKLPILTQIILPASEKPNALVLKRKSDPVTAAKYSLYIKERRYLNKEYEYPGTTFILGTYVATIDFKTYFGTLTENKNLAQTWRMFFEFIWDHLS